MLQITVQLTHHTINSPVFPTAEILSFKKDTMLLISYFLPRLSLFCRLFFCCWNVTEMFFHYVQMLDVLYTHVRDATRLDSIRLGFTAIDCDAVRNSTRF